MTTRKTIQMYLAITFAVISPVCVIVLALSWLDMPIYGTAAGFIAIALGGVSTALAGAFTAKRSGRIGRYSELIKAFFHIKQPVRYYIMMFGFLLLALGYSVLFGGLQANHQWLELPKLFLVAILFGGIEEIGWRYLFQPTLEQRMSFAVASMVTFGLWAVWHMMYFVVDGSIFSMRFHDIISFLLGLLRTSFVLGAIFRVSKSLWLCVCCHAMLNAFTQILTAPSILESAIITALCVGGSLLLVRFLSSQQGNEHTLTQ